MSVTGLSRAELAAEVARLRADGLTHRAIAGRLGISRSYAAALDTDPDNAKQRARRESYQGVCERCGGVTKSNGTSKPSGLCAGCGRVKSGESNRLWTSERVIASIQWWNERYDEPPAMADWNPNTASRRGDSARAARARQHIAAGEIPWATHAVRIHGSWNAAIAAAGFDPRAGIGNRANAARRKGRVLRVAA